MKKVFLLIIIIALSAAGYFYYQEYYKTDDLSLWSFVPDHALIVYENARPAETYNELLRNKVGKTLLELPEVASFNEELKQIDTIGGRSTFGSLMSDLLLISIHRTSKNSFGVAYYKQLNSQEKKESFSRLIDAYKDRPDYSFATRKYQGSLIYELINNKAKTVFSYFFENNVLVASSVPFLVEDVIRILDGDNLSFEQQNKSLFQLPELTNDQGNLYLNTERFNEVLEVFVQSDINIGSLGRGTFLDTNTDDKGMYLNGFTEYDNNDFLSVFNQQKPVSSNINYFIPNSAAYSMQFGFDQSNSFFGKLKEYYSENDREWQQSFMEFNQDYNLGEEFGADWVSEIMAVVELEREQGQLLYLHTSDINEALNDLNLLGESIAKTKGDSVYLERYSSYQLRELDIQNFVNNRFYPYLSKTTECYYTAVEDYIVISSSILNLKRLLDDLEQENTWGRSVNFNSFMDRALEEFNLSIIVNTERYLETVLDEFDPNWKQFVSVNRSVLSNLQPVVAQWSKLDENFYTSILSGLTEQKRKENQNFKITQNVNFKNRLITKPFVVKNHVSNLNEVLVMDSIHYLHLIGNDGNKLWSKVIGEPIVGEVYQVDFYKNNKLQYFFATPKALHIIDRNGNYLEGYPKVLSSDVKYVNVVDYDNSKRYRFLTADERGNLRLYNKEGENLEGWTPLNLDGRLAAQPFHLRVRRKDCFVVVKADGKISLINRRGENLPGFPIDLENRINTGVDVSIGSDFKSTIFNTITHDGQLVSFNMEGKIKETNQLYKPSKESEFRIVSDALGKSFILVRKDLNRIVILNSEAKELFAKDYLDAESMEIQYYDFSSSNKLIAVTDKVQGFTYLYNGTGKLINSRPINSEFEIGVIYSEANDYLKIYCNSDKSFNILQFN